MYLQDLLAAVDVRAVHHDVTVETAGAQKRRVQDVGPVRCRDEDGAAGVVKAVQLHQELVQRLLALVVPPAEPRTPVTPDGVDFVDKNDAGLIFLGLLEEVAHARRPHADEHLHKVRAADAEERHIRLTRRRTGQKGLARAGRAQKQNTARDLGTQPGELRGVLQEMDDLLQFLLGLVAARNIVERHLGAVVQKKLCLALGEGHHLAASALHVVEEEYPHADQQKGRKEGGEHRHPPRRLLRCLDGDDRPLLRGFFRQAGDIDRVGQKAGPILELSPQHRGAGLPRNKVCRSKIQRKSNVSNPEGIGIGNRYI